MLDFLIELDQKLLLFLNGLNHPFLDPVMFYISYKFTWIPLYLFLLVLVFWRYKWKGFLVLIFIVLLVTLSDQGSVFVKNTIMRLRPCREPLLDGLLHMVSRCPGGYSFVSSHATNTFALAIFINKLLGLRFRFVVPVMIAYAALNAYSRVYLGVHYPGDVIFGSLLGILIGWLVFFLWEKLNQFIAKNRVKAGS